MGRRRARIHEPEHVPAPASAPTRGRYETDPVVAARTLLEEGTPVPGPYMLAELRKVAALRERLQERERLTVALARRSGMSWEVIGQALGQSGPGVFRRYRDTGL